jgi:hypothetical protein
MSKVQISPIRVIHSIESTNGPINTEVISIVAVDREENQCWDEQNRLFTLSEVEEWPRPQDDVFMTPIAPLETSTIAADGTVIKDTLQPIQKRETFQGIQHNVPQSQGMTQAEIDASIQEKAMKLAAEMRALEMSNRAKVTSVDMNDDDIELDKFVKRFIDKSSTFDKSTKRIKVTSTIDLDKLFLLADSLGFDKLNTLKAIIANDAMQIDSIED